MSNNHSEQRRIASSTTAFLARHPRLLVAGVVLLVGIATQGTVGAEVTFVEPYNGHSTSTGP
ncbi:hypothetical protein [Haloprofundus salilacus]|uniref:hypothetical protein n=1 Tax=Haloprofundus salilacus TaxID=2876190 RepID=UPI001CCBE35F|nr:hypothetical protein [Haloprofundus salilacus]